VVDNILLLDHQAEFIEDDTTRHILLLAGYGAGKTHAFIGKALDLAMKNVGHTGILLEPTAPLLHDILIPDFTTLLENYDIEHTLVKSPQPNLTIRFEHGETKILLRSLENWQRLVGVNAAFIGTDEMDTVKKEVALMAYKKLQGRLRKGNVRQMFNTTTPEGFSAAYELFEKLKIGRTIHAKTFDNPFLPKDFIDDLIANYPPNLLQAYLEGRYVNLKSGAVYSYFDRKKHHADITADTNETLFIGQDFNVGACISTVHIIRGDKVIRVDEISSKHTFDIPSNIRAKYQNNKVVMFPDASGKADKSNASKSDIQILREAGFTIEAPQANGRIQDRVNAVNGLISHDRYFINTNKCPKGTEAIEQQVYDKSGVPEKFAGAGTIDDYNDSFGYFIVRRFPLTKNNIATSSFQMR